MLKTLKVLIIITLGVSVLTAGRWYTYVTNINSPYDEVGIELNSRMPLQVRAWGCNKLHATFPKALPPLGCARPEGPANQWM
jgi:hypothetical protein